MLLRTCAIVDSRTPVASMSTAEPPDSLGSPQMRCNTRTQLRGHGRACRDQRLLQRSRVAPLRTVGPLHCECAVDGEDHARRLFGTKLVERRGLAAHNETSLCHMFRMLPLCTVSDTSHCWKPGHRGRIDSAWAVLTITYSWCMLRGIEAARGAGRC